MITISFAMNIQNSNLELPLRNKLADLPGYNGPILTQYTGYITVNPDLGKAYFYWFVESQRDPNTDPLLVWYQGGPGCSGLIGLFTEHGPFTPNADGGLDYSDISWTEFANVLYLEQPAGVGFSYSNNTDGYTTNDTQAAIDNFNFLEGWLKVFPEFQGRNTWLTGESYAGVYVPTLVDYIVQRPSSMIASQLTGFTVGNPVISCESADYNAIQMDLFYYHALVSYSVYYNWTSTGCSQSSAGAGCSEILQTAINQIGVIFQQKRQSEEPNLDPDCLYQDFCLGNGTLEFAVNQGYPNACSPLGTETTNYLNQAAVQQAIGAVTTTWAECSSTINYGALGQSMIPFYQNIFEVNPSLDVLVYSGDVDIYTVPFGFTKACLHELKEIPTNQWQPWYVNEATGGYFEQFPHYTYATIKGAGHEAPQYQPLVSYELISRFIYRGTLEDRRHAPKPREHKMTQARLLKQLGIRV